MKVTFGSPEWLDLARETLTALVTANGEAGRQFSFCEVWTSAPSECVGADSTGRAGWHLRVDGTTCLLEAGVADDTDIARAVDYETVLPFARLRLAVAGSTVPKMQVLRGDPRTLPGYFHSLHDALADRTA